MGQTTQVFDLPEELTVDRAEEIQRQVVEWADSIETELKCRGTDVRKIDAAGLQLLLSLYKTAAKEARKFAIISPSPQMKDVFACSGVREIFTIEEVG